MGGRVESSTMDSERFPKYLATPSLAQPNPEGASSSPGLRLHNPNSIRHNIVVTEVRRGWEIRIRAVHGSFVNSSFTSSAIYAENGGHMAFTDFVVSRISLRIQPSDAEDLANFLTCTDEESALSVLRQLEQPPMGVASIGSKSFDAPVGIKRSEDKDEFTGEALLDCGAENCYVHPQFVQDHDLRPSVLPFPIGVNHADGTLNANGAITLFVELVVRVKDHVEFLPFYVTNLGSVFDLVIYVSRLPSSSLASGVAPDSEAMDVDEGACSSATTSFTGPKRTVDFVQPVFPDNARKETAKYGEVSVGPPAEKK
ncbi:hypothetical protein NMY22_g18701 [Coprinellus aureogranulatus]|nr:hypothetical protein NMY22_g18701 [Coprinellus aureogranulatus]